MEQLITKNSIELIQYFPANYLAKLTYKIVDGKLVSIWENIFSLYETNFNLKDFNPEYSVGRREYDNWGNIAGTFFFVFLGFNIGFSWIKSLKIYFFYSFIFLLPSLIFFLMRFIKYDWVYFEDKTHNNSFQIRLPNKNSPKRKVVEDFVKSLKEEIERAQKRMNGSATIN